LNVTFWSRVTGNEADAPRRIAETDYVQVTIPVQREEVRVEREDQAQP